MERFQRGFRSIRGSTGSIDNSSEDSAGYLGSGSLEELRVSEGQKVQKVQKVQKGSEVKGNWKFLG